MDNTLAKIKNAVKYGGYIDNNDYAHLMKTAKEGLPADAADAQTILRTYNYNKNHEVNYYKYRKDPLEHISGRNTYDEERFGNCSSSLF